MTVLYLDSSAFVKLYVAENAADTLKVEQALNVWPEVASCQIAHAEVCGVFGRQFQQQRLDEHGYWQTRQAFEADWESVGVVHIDAKVSSVAADLLKAHARLRAMDALHLAAALQVRAAERMRFLTFDRHLERAAQALMPDAFPT